MDILNSHNHFKRQWTTTFYPPKNIAFVIYDKEIWHFIQGFLKGSVRIVDLGAGGGTLLFNISKVTQAQLIAVDFSSEALAQLKKMVPEAKILEEDVVETSIDNASCDFVLSTMTIEHVNDTKLLQEVYRIVKEHGYFLVTTVLKTPRAWYFYKNRDGVIVLEPSHLREYTSVQNFLALLNRHGFKIMKAKTPKIKFPLVDPILKLLFRIFKTKFWGKLPTTRPLEYIRKITRVPIPGYYAIEVVAQKQTINR